VHHGHKTQARNKQRHDQAGERKIAIFGVPLRSKLTGLFQLPDLLISCFHHHPTTQNFLTGARTMVPSWSLLRTILTR